MNVEEKQNWLAFVNPETDLDKKEQIRQILLNNYLPLVRYVVGRLAVSFPSSVVEYGDLYHSGVLGLMDALERFQPELGLEFSTFATRRIRGSVLDELRALDWIPRSVREKANRVAEACMFLSQKLKRVPSDEEVADELQLTIDEYFQLTSKIRVPPVHSLEDLMGEDSSDRRDSLLARVPQGGMNPENELDRQEALDILTKGIKGLSNKEQLILELYYNEELTLKEVAKVLDLSESRICQIHAACILKLRGYQTAVHKLAA